jgi:hypothetical protein
MKRHPENHLDLGDRIFVRLLNPMWRNPFGKEYTSEQQKEIEAVRWIDRYCSYIRDLEDLLCGVLQQSEVFQSLPIHEIPVLPRAHIGADECLRKLGVQEQALKHFADRGARLPPGMEGELENLRAKARAAINNGTIGDCLAKIGLNRDTIRDFASGRIRRPRPKTLDKLEDHFKHA